MVAHDGVQRGLGSLLLVLAEEPEQRRGQVVEDPPAQRKRSGQLGPRDSGVQTQHFGVGVDQPNAGSQLLRPEHLRQLRQAVSV